MKLLKNTYFFNIYVHYNVHMTGCMGKRVFCDTGGNFEKCTF